MSKEEEKRCPLCAEEMDWTDLQFMPCQCGYQVCVWCWHHIIDMAEKDETEGRCPACRTIYEKEKIVATQANCERTMSKISNRKTKPPKAKPKAIEVKKDLTNIRVIQRKMAYVIGLPLSLADEDVLLMKEYFGQYGKVTKVSLSRTAGGAIQQFINDTCSVYITYSKEEEALRCIGSVHGFVLDGRFLRASFGTAKYCHAWLKNMPCNNPACLYLHSIGADEDSFGKDEVAAVHTRSRVQKIVGATNSVAKRTGNVLPPPGDDFCISSSTFGDKTTMGNDISDLAYGSGNSSADILPYKEKEGPFAVPHKTTTFVDIVGRPNSSTSENEGNISEDRRMLNLCSELSSVPHKTTTFVDIVGRPNSSTSENEGNISEDRRMLNLCSELSSVTVSGDAHTEVPYSVPSLFKVSSSNCIPNDLFKSSPDEPLGEGSLLSNNQGYNRTSYVPPFYSTNISEDSGGLSSLNKKMHSMNSFTVGHDSVHNRDDEACLPIRCLNSVSSDSCQEMKFQNSAKSDRIYRSSKSFSNEEIVEHLRRIGDDNVTNGEEGSVLDAVESSIVSNIMSIDFDSCEDSLAMPNGLSEILDDADGMGCSSWSSLNSDQSGYSFAKQDGFASQMAASVLPDYGDNKEQYFCKPQYPVIRSQTLAPPGFSMPSRDPPPGFSSGDRAALPRPTSGNRLTNTPSFSSSLFQTSTRHDDIPDFFDPAILRAGTANQMNGFNNTAFDESRHWLRQHQNSQFSQFYTPQPEMSYSDIHKSNGISGLDSTYGLSSRLVREQQNRDPSFFTQTPQQKYGNWLVSNSNGYLHGLDEVQHKGDGGMTELHRSQRLGVDYFPGYGDLMFSSGDVYTRVFGL